jgi:hypothetical protein
MCVHLSGKHPPKLEAPDIGHHAFHILDDIRERTLVLFSLSKREQFARVLNGLIEPGKRLHYALEFSALLAEVLSTLGVRPNVARFELSIDLFETLALFLVVKGTP